MAIPVPSLFVAVTITVTVAVTVTVTITVAVTVTVAVAVAVAVTVTVIITGTVIVICTIIVMPCYAGRTSHTALRYRLQAVRQAAGHRPLCQWHGFVAFRVAYGSWYRLWWAGKVQAAGKKAVAVGHISGGGAARRGQASARCVQTCTCTCA